MVAYVAMKFENLFIVLYSYNNFVWNFLLKIPRDDEQSDLSQSYVHQSFNDANCFWLSFQVLIESC